MDRDIEEEIQDYCLKKHRQASRKYYAENSEQIKERVRRYRSTHRDKVNEWQRKYRATHGDKIREYHRQYHARLKENSHVEEKAKEEI